MARSTLIAAAASLLLLGVSPAAFAGPHGGGHGSGGHMGGTMQNAGPDNPHSNAGGEVRGLDRSDSVAGQHGDSGRDKAAAKQARKKKHSKH